MHDPALTDAPVAPTESNWLDGAGVSTTDQHERTNRWIGRQLRAVREQREWSLTDVERASNGGFGPSTIGAYERGERTLSLDRLRRLAVFYGVPISRFVPTVENPTTIPGRRSPLPGRLAIDVDRLAAVETVPAITMLRFVRMIAGHRSESPDRVVTLRGSDAVAVAAMLDVRVDEVLDALDAGGLLG